MMYSDTRVKAKIQFILQNDNDRFNIGALSFNDVPQNELIKASLLTKIFDDDSENEEALQQNIDGQQTMINDESNEEINHASQDALLEDAITLLSIGKIPNLSIGIGDEESIFSSYRDEIIKEHEMGNARAYEFDNAIYHVGEFLAGSYEVTSIEFIEGQSLMGVKVGLPLQNFIDEFGEPQYKSLEGLDGDCTLRYEFGLSTVNQTTFLRASALY
ncbi:hypothetical protein [Paenibacillus aquistagni]|uniref:hypothetical protein n=1 Tax=Paenibacillus aquistagni TaxID=1852522 RepID=UPI00145A6962|nr:hypothetical protein [Paenibacillus aquistagni]NMM53669.1 hypothetical protein [Paenibacillus aquistagni]